MTGMAAMTRAELLQAHIDAVTDKEVEWGVDDCSPWCARWLYMAAGIVVPINLKYVDREEAKTIIKAAGGLQFLWERFLSSAGVYPRYSRPCFGDIGLVNTATWGPIGAIFSSDGIAVCRHAMGASFIRPRDDTIVKVWALPEL